jgi:two-component system nitrogen regulation sensor histidine kinase NtrY
MTFRLKLLIALALAVVVTVGLVSWIVSTTTEVAFAELDEERTQALVAQFRREFSHRAAEVARRVDGVVRTEAVVRLLIELNRPQSDLSVYLNTAQEQATTQALDFLELVGPDGTIISSAHWAARFGYKHDWVLHRTDWLQEPAFLQRVELAEGTTLGLIAVRPAAVGEQKLWVIGGQKLGQSFLASLSLPAGMRALLYTHLEPSFSPRALTSSLGTPVHAATLAPLIEEVLEQGREKVRVISWPEAGRSAETFHAIPLFGRAQQLLAVLLVGSSREELVALTRFIRRLAWLVGASGILLGLLISWWVTRRVTRPVQELAESARRVAAGHWDTRVEVRSNDEIGQLANAFNRMTQQLIEQRGKLIQTERVAAWRELARRLAHELKNPLFPLQITVENLERAKQYHPDQFDEVFRESTATLAAELSNLKTIISRFSDFSKMPPPQLEPVNVNETVRQVLKLFDAQFKSTQTAVVHPQVILDETLNPIAADPEQLKRALQNLVLNALDAMPSGGTLTLRTQRQNGKVQIEVSDTGTGLTSEECERLFTPYYTSKRHGTGLGLAIVQSVVSDHGGKISVTSQPGRGSTFRVELPSPSEPRP